MGTGSAILGGAAMAALISGIFGLINRRLDKKERCDQGVALLQEAEMVILYDRINYLGKCYIRDEEISAEDLQAIVKMHDVYHRLGGNGYLDTIMSKVKSLRSKEAETK